MMVCGYCVNDTPRTQAQLTDRRATAELLGTRLHIIPCSECGQTDYYLTDRFVARPLPLMDGMPMMPFRPIVYGCLLSVVLVLFLITGLYVWIRS